MRKYFFEIETDFDMDQSLSEPWEKIPPWVHRGIWENSPRPHAHFPLQKYPKCMIFWKKCGKTAKNPFKMSKISIFLKKLREGFHIGAFWE